MLVLADVDVAGLGELIELAFDHAQRDVAQQPDDIERVLRQRQRHRLDVQVVAEQDGDVVAPPRVHGQSAAPQLGLVDDVVVDQRGGVDELDDRRVEHGAIAGVAASRAAISSTAGPDALAAAGPDVSPDLRNQLDPRLDLPHEFLFDLVEVGADRLEDLREIGGDDFLRQSRLNAR